MTARPMVAMLLLCLLAFVKNTDAAGFHNGFKLTNSLIPEKDILSGGPGRDGIPSIDAPRFVTPDQALFLSGDDLIVAVSIAGVARAYPLRILVWHEVVNDQMGDQAFAVTYCPLCGSAMVFNRKIYGEDRSFGVSGLLYQSDVLMYDRETESLWSQLAMKAVTGPMSNTTLELMPSEIMSWAAWKEKHPHGTVLSTNTGFARDYTQNSYEEYTRSPHTAFPAPWKRPELPPKAWIAGVVLGGEARAYPLETLAAQGPIIDRIGNVGIKVSYTTASGHVSVNSLVSSGVIPHVKSYWFAWQAFYPHTIVRP